MPRCGVPGGDGLSPYLDPDSREPLPFGVRLLILFLLVDATERILEVALSLGWGRPLGPLAGPIGTLPTTVGYLVLACWVLVNILLAVLLAYRLEAGRIWACVAFALHLVYVINYAGYQAPQLWMAVGEVGRVRILLTAGIDGAAVAYLCAKSTREAIAE